MLLLKDIVKVYSDGNNDVKALKGVNVEFRKSEFVSILGHSGCGKTTLLNIIGGLDHYTCGDLIIKGISTKKYKDTDWDVYRNHSIGFVFQSYNLIPHQTVLANVELALTLSGVSPAERTRRAKEALKKVGLGDQIKKKPNQLSGGQMQRVAIARALVNDPEILLADEPTGALDTDTSIQIMDILREVAKDRLVIMVTHNPELAAQYSTRIIRLVDGHIVSDSMPYDSSADATAARDTSAQVQKSKKRHSMSFLTALALSLNNLLTKKARTILTSFAGSIGIIGIALILALSDGIQIFITQLQEDTLSSYPISITSESVQLADMMSILMENANDDGVDHELDKVYSNSSMFDLANAMLNMDVHVNDLKALKQEFSADSSIWNHVSDIQYVYSQTLHLYSTDPSGEYVKVNPSSIMNQIASAMGAAGSMMSSSLSLCSEMINNLDLLNSQYDVIAGEWPKSYNEVVLVVDKNNEINDLYLYALGIKDPDEIEKIMQAAIKGETYESEDVSFTYEELLGKTFSLVLPADYYRYDEETGVWVSMKSNANYCDYLARTGTEIKISAIVRPAPESVAQSIGGVIGYTHALTEYVIAKNGKSPAVLAQLANLDVDIFTGLKFDDGSLDGITDAQKAAMILEHFGGLSVEEKAELYRKIASTPTELEIQSLVDKYLEDFDTSRENIIKTIMEQGSSQMEGIPPSMIESYLETMSDEKLVEAIRMMTAEAIRQQFAEDSASQLEGMTADQLAVMFDAKIQTVDEVTLVEYYDTYMPSQFSSSTLEANQKTLSLVDKETPRQINIYASTFEDKDSIVAYIDAYNERMKAEGHSEKVIKYTDMVGLLMSSVTQIVDIVSIVLIAFVAISLVVSSIMIGVITYISVIERTKEIGILRAIGASKKDITHVFNAETAIIGFVSGAMGIIITLILLIPANLIIEAFTDIPNIAALPVVGAILLVIISIAITLVAGLFPALIAAKKDPVVALRSE